MTCDSVIEKFARDGWAIVEGLLSSPQIEQIQRAVRFALEQPGEESKWIRPRTYQWFDVQPIFVELMEHPFVIEFATRWLGDDFHLIAAQCSRNTRADFYAPGASAWHQDRVFFPPPERITQGVAPQRYSFSAMWYVQDTPLEMGPTELMSGYRNDPPDEYSARSLHRQHMPAGSLLLFNHRTWHRGAPNQTSTPRDLITNAYARREIEKTQLMTACPDGSQAYIPCQALLDSGSQILRKLL
jgi:hypothetical protein